jgi:hypothetical protein
MWPEAAVVANYIFSDRLLRYRHIEIARFWYPLRFQASEEAFCWRVDAPMSRHDVGGL